MHNAQARLRAVECGRYVLRAANTGISSVITNKGEVVISLGALEEGMIVENICPRNSATLYSVVGNFFVYMCAFGNITLISVGFLYKIGHNKSKKVLTL